MTFQTRYSSYDPDKNQNKVTIVGNPSLSDVRTMMIGVRNNSNAAKDIVVWVNEMRLTDFDQSGGWAAKANVNLGLSDIATLNIAGHVETVGFGGIDQSLTERRLDDYYQYNIATMVELGRFLPEKVKLKAPLFYSITEQRTSPKYNPLDQDILLKDALDNAGSKAERDSISDASIEKSTVESFSLSGVSFDIRSKNPMPYDPANFSISYSYNRQSKQDPTTEFENTYDYRGSFTYSYTPFVKPFVPLKGLKSKSKHLKFLKEWEFNYLPNNIAFNTNMSRYYYEQQIRDVSGSGGMALPTSVSKSFLWDRQFSLTWNLTKSINLSLQTMTNAHIEEPVGVVNKQMSAWYMFNCIGFYPVAPSSNIYNIGSPCAEAITVRMSNGKNIEMTADNWSPKNLYVKELYVNGKKYDKSYLTYDDIRDGVKLRFVMSSKPNYKRAVSDEAVPPSISLPEKTLKYKSSIGF